MALYSLAVRHASLSSGIAILEVYSTGTVKARLLEMGRELASNTTAIMGFGRPSTVGGTPSSPVTFLPYNPTDPTSTIKAATAWSVGPVAPTQFLMRGFGGGGRRMMRWMFPGGIIFGPSDGSSLALWNFGSASTGVISWYFVVDE